VTHILNVCVQITFQPVIVACFYYQTMSTKNWKTEAIEENIFSNMQ